MPLYELFCLTRPQLQLNRLSEVIKRAAVAVLDNGGVVTDIKCYGTNELAYKIRKSHGHYAAADMFKLNFMVTPKILGDLEHDLRVDEDVLRWVVLKHKALPNLPSTRKMFKIPELKTKPDPVLYPPPEKQKKVEEPPILF